MRPLLLFLLGSLACGSVIGIAPDAGSIDAGEPDAAPPDATDPPDAPPPPRIDSITLDEYLATGTSVPVTAALRAQPRQALTVAFEGGTFDVTTHELEADLLGDAAATASYTAPATAGDRVLTVRVTDPFGQSDAEPVIARVRDFEHHGFDAAFTAQHPAGLPGGFLFAQKVTVPSSLLVRLGVVGTQATGQLRLGVYQDTGSPGAKLVETPVFSVPAGGREVPVPSTPLGGSYWIVLLADTATPISRQPDTVGDVLEHFGAQDFAAGLPATFPGTAASALKGPFAVYLVVVR